MTGNEIRETLTTERRERDGKTYIVVNHAAWYPADKFTEATAEEDYASTHENGGWNFVPRRHCPSLLAKAILPRFEDVK